jgi:hypothetical protein
MRFDARVPNEKVYLFKQLQQWQRFFCIMMDKLSIVTCDAQELLHIFCRFRNGPVSSRGHLVLVHLYAFGGPHMAQKLHFRLDELALVAFGKEFVFPEPYQSASEVIYVLSLIFAGHQNVIQIDYHKLPHFVLVHRI